jgi:hypothetical protein
MATTVAQPGTGLRKIAKQYADQAGMPVDQFLQRLQRLNPEFNRANENTVRLGRGVKPTPAAGDAPAGDAPAGDAPAEDAPAENAGGFELANILESPLYTQNLKDYYLSQYLPGLTQATFNINQAQTELGANEANRARQRGEAIKRVAGSYAARGMRSPAAINRDRSEIQSEFANLSRAERNQLQALMNERDVMFGAGAQTGETFLSDPTKFGSIGAGARRSALGSLQEMPELYNLLGLGASRAPLVPVTPPTTPAASGEVSAAGATAPKTKAPAVGPTAAQRRAAEAEALKQRQAEAVRQQAAQRQQAAARAQQAARTARTVTVPGRAR